MSEIFDSFDLKVTKLTGRRWDRNNLAHLAEQLLEGQGRPRASVENRVIICFDWSKSSDMAFLEANRDLIIHTLLEIADNPYKFTYWLERYHCWCALALIRRGQYSEAGQGQYYEHPIGDGLREPGKAQFETEVLTKVAGITKNVRLNPMLGVHGNDGQIRIDRSKLFTEAPPPTALPSALLPPDIPQDAHSSMHICAGCRALAIHLWWWWEMSGGVARVRHRSHGTYRDGKWYCQDCTGKVG